MTSPNQIVPYGFCHCGCGKKTTVATRNRARTGIVNGQPMNFIVGHKPRVKMADLDAKPFKIDGAYCRLIPLTRGQFAIVDADDYEWLMSVPWQAQPMGTGARGFYASHRNRIKIHNVLLPCGEGQEVDHINRCGLDNRRANLRRVRHSENSKNASKRRDNTSGYRGVHLKGKKYAASMQSDGVKMYFGVFSTPEEAAREYDIQARKLHGEFASTNF